MFRGFYSVASGMIAQQRRTEMLSNNLTNVNTPGFKAEQASIRSFPDMFMSSLNAQKLPVQNNFSVNKLSPVGELSTGVYMAETVPLMTQGQLIETDLTTDIALLDGVLPVDAETGEPGAVFFRLENENGTELYSKNGNFRLSPDGYLTNPMGYYVLDTDGQRIQLPNEDIEVDEFGAITSGGQAVANIGTAFAARPAELQKIDNGLFASDGNLPQAAAGFSFRQGFIEGSNVDAGRTMTDMMAAYRAFEANQKILQAYDRSMEKAVTEIGRVNG